MLGNKFTKIIAILTILFVTTSSVGSEHEPTINLVSFVNPPYIFENDSEQIGMINKLSEQLFTRAEIKYTLELMPKKRALLYVEKTSNTCVLPIERNQEREVKFIWISPVLISVTGLFQLSERLNGYRLITIMDALDFRVGSHLGSASGTYLRELGFKVDSIPQNSANIYKLRAGRIDYWESDILTAKYISQQANIDISDSQLDFFTQLYAIACNPSMPPNSVKQIRNSLYDMYHDGTIDQITSEYQSLPSP